MKTKELSPVEQSVNDYVCNTCGKSYTVRLIGETKRDNDWVCDEWRFAFGDVSFEYFTGTGHREPNDTAKLAMVALKNVSRRSIAWHDGVIKNMVAVQPPIAGLIHSLLLDGEAGTMTFSEWCASYGYDTDSRKALATYETCQQTADKFNRIFTRAQREHLRELLSDY